MTTKNQSQYNIKVWLPRIILITLGAIIMAVALELFLIPNALLDGGIVGISIILSQLTGMQLGLFIFILNIPFFYLGYKQIGLTFALSTAYGITVLSIATSQLHSVQAFVNEPFLATIFGGLILGIGVGLVIRVGGSLDGSEIFSIVVTKYLPFSVGEIVMIINLVIFTVAGFVFTWTSAMYSIIAYFIAYKTMDVVILGIDESKSVFIITDEYEEISKAIMHRLGRGVTYLNGEGAYTNDEKKVIFTVITRLEEAKLKSLVHEKDINAFVAIGNVSEVHGGNFKKRDIH